MRGRRRRGSLVPCALVSCDVITVCMFGVGYGVALCFRLIQSQGTYVMYSTVMRLVER